MDHIQVSSSNIDSIGYDPETQVLAVKFKNGGLYHYHGVPPEEHSHLVNAPIEGSHGKHLNQRIKTKYTAERKD
jgi:hypothetical protein